MPMEWAGRETDARRVGREGIDARRVGRERNRCL